MADKDKSERAENSGGAAKAAARFTLCVDKIDQIDYKDVTASPLMSERAKILPAA